MKPLFFGSITLLGAWLVQPTLQVDHEPVGTTTGATATTSAPDDQSVHPPATTKGGRTMR